MTRFAQRRMTYWEMLDRLVLAACSLIVDHRRTADRLRITTSHSISRFARMRMADERLSQATWPSSLITRSNAVACSIGMSAGLAPFRVSSDKDRGTTPVGVSAQSFGVLPTCKSGAGLYRFWRGSFEID